MSFSIATAVVGGAVLGSVLGGGPDTPDTSGVNAAAVQQAQLSREQLDFAKQIYADSAPDRTFASERARLLSDQQLEAGNLQTGLTRDYQNYLQTTFRPLERRIVRDAQAYDTEARRDDEAGRAIADVTQQFNSTRNAQMRDLTRMGVNPNSGRFAAMSNQFSAQEALAKASAATGARRNVETQSYARMQDAANLGRNLPSNQATSAQIALQQGNSAGVNAQTPLNVASSGAGILNSGFATAGNLNSSSGNLFAQQANLQRQSGDSGLGALGQVAGAYAGSAAGSAQLADLFAASDEKTKKNITPTDPDEALEAVEKTPVSAWQYKDGVPASDGGRPHIGPMAQMTRKNMGEKVAPGGKQIDLISMNGITMAAIQALSQKVDRLATSTKGGNP